MTETPASSAFRLAYVPGVTPAKWARVWSERLPETPLDLVLVPAAAGEPSVRSGEADAALVRLPVDKDELHAIPLYTETTVVVMPKDHRLTEAAEVPLAELAEELVLHPQDDVLGWPGQQPPGQAANERPETTKDALELVAAGIGVVLVPQSLARLHHRRDLTYRPVPEGDAPQSQVALAWRQDHGSELVEEMIGIVRGRTVNSSRGSTATAAANQAPKKPAARRQAQSQPQQRRQKPAARGGKQTSHGGKPTAKRGKPGRG